MSVQLLTVYVSPSTVIISQIFHMTGWMRKSNHVANTLIKSLWQALQNNVKCRQLRLWWQSEPKIEKTSLSVITSKASLPINPQNFPPRNYCTLTGLEYSKNTYDNAWFNFQGKLSLTLILFFVLISPYSNPLTQCEWNDPILNITN